MKLTWMAYFLFLLSSFTPKNIQKKVRMKLTWMACFLFLLSRFTSISGHSIQKRSVLQFGAMIHKVTHRKAIDFNEYASYCGIGGSGEVLDEIDHCCKKHDDCYGRANSMCLDIFNLSVYLSIYKWFYNGTNIICENDDLCNQNICLCDQIAANCFAENIADYNPKLRDLSPFGRLIRAIFKHIPVFG